MNELEKSIRYVIGASCAHMKPDDSCNRCGWREKALADLDKLVAAAQPQARAEAMMDASWLIWEDVVCTGPQLKTVKRCRERIESAAQLLFPGAKAYHARPGATRPPERPCTRDTADIGNCHIHPRACPKPKAAA